MRYRTGLVALVMAGVIAVTAPAYASHDPVTTLSTSNPGGYRLVGYHHDQVSPRVDCWTGLQNSAGRYRFWYKCADRYGARVVVDLGPVTFTHVGYATYTADPNPREDAPVYLTGGWHPIAAGGDQYRSKATAWIHVQGVGTVGTRCLATWTTAGNGQALSEPVC